MTKAVLLLAVGLAGGGAAVAVATVPDSGGVIHGCYPVDGSGNPAAGATLTIIDPSAGQGCSTFTPGRGGQRALDWNQSGPPGAQGAAGQQGPQGPPGNTITVAKGGTLTLPGGQVLQVESAGGGITLPTPTRHLPGGSDVVMGSGADAVTFPILDVSLLGNSAAGHAATGGASLHDISITKQVDKSSPKLAQVCASGKHIPSVTITLRKAGGGKQYLRYTLSQVFVGAIQSAGTNGKGILTEQVTLNFAKIKIQYSGQKPG